MRALLDNHPLVGQKALFDWRSEKEKKTEEPLVELPDLSWDKRFVYGTVSEVRKDCYGDLWVTLEEYRLPQPHNKMVSFNLTNN
jgi:hypothetical protein